MVAVGGGAGVVLAAVFGGEGARVAAGDGVGVKDHMGQPGDGLGHAGVIALDELVDHGDFVLQVHELVQRHGPLGHGVDAAQAGAGVDLDAVSTGAGEDLGGVGLAGGGDGAGQEQVGLGGGLEKQRSVFSQLLLAGVSPEVGDVIGLGHVCGAILHGDGGGLHGGLHKQPGVGVHGGGGEGQHVVLGGGGGFAHRDLVGGGDGGIVAAVLIQGHDGRGALGHGGDLALLGDGGHGGVGGGPDHVHGAGGAVGIVGFGGEGTGLADGQDFRTGGVQGQAGDLALGDGHVARGLYIADRGGNGSIAFCLCCDRSGLLFAVGIRNFRNSFIAGLPSDALVGILAGQSSGQRDAVFGRDRCFGLI